MTTYNLEETPNVFVAPYENKTKSYQMIQFNERPDCKIIGDINLDKDKLIIHGTEITEQMLQKLYDSLRLGPSGTIFVNCNGACRIWMKKEGFNWLHHNVIFDWSPFGVIVPNSVNDILRKELQQKYKELALMSANNDGLLEASNKEIKELREQLSTCRKDRDVEFQKVRNQLCSIGTELQSTKIELKSSNKDIKDLECKLLSTRKENHDIVIELQKVQNEFSSCKLELELSRSQLESSNRKIIEHEEQLIKVQDQLSTTNNDQLQSMKILLEFTEAKEDESLVEYVVNKTVEIVDE